MDKLAKNTQIMKQRMAIELCALQPEITNKQLAKQLGVAYNKMCTWRNDPRFIEKTVDRFMELIGNEIPMVMQALVREAKEGNTRACELFLKQMGRLQDTLILKVEAPFTQHLKSKHGEITESDATIMGEELDKALVEVEFEELPPRNPENNTPVRKTREDFDRTRYAIKRAKKNADRNKRYGLRKRAEKVGLEPLSGGRPHPAKRKAWVRKLQKMEKEQLKNGK